MFGHFMPMFTCLFVLFLLSHSKGAEKSGENDKGDSWWETWKEILYQDEWR